MSVELVNGHVLFPNAADWSQRPSWKRLWQSGITGAVNGAESRIAMRQRPRISLTSLITPRDVVEQNEHDDRIRAALKSGLACAPYHGRGCLLQSDVDGAAEAIVDNRFAWQAGDWLFLQDGERHEALEVQAADLDAGEWTLTLADVPALVYPAGTFVWPLLFGKPASEDPEAVNANSANNSLTITELVSMRTAQIGDITPPEGDGIGVWVVGEFVIP